MKEIKNLTPIDATHVGEILLDELEANEINQKDFSKLTGIQKTQLNEIIKGKRGINADIALLFEKALGIDASYWLEIQKNYELDKAKIENKNQERLEAIEKIAFIKDKIPFNYFKKQGFISGDPIEDIPKIKNIYSIDNFESLATINAQPSYVRFRKSTHQSFNLINTIGWVKLVQFKALNEIAPSFNLRNKEALIIELKQLLVENTNTKERIKQKLSEYGIKLIFQSKAEKTPVDGISFWSNSNPAIGMTLRHSRLDNFAFTLFHELAHVLLHLPNSNKAEFIDLEHKAESDLYKNSIEEKEANDFATECLIDRTLWKSFVLNKKTIYKFNDGDIRRFAKQCHIHPAIVKGQLCNYYNNYRVKSQIENVIK